MIGQVISHYRILSKIGGGAMGEVYVAEDTQLGRRVAIKFPVVTADEHQYRSRFLREARSASTLSHPHIAAIHDYGETTDGHPFLVMELVDGPNLSEYLHERGLPLTRALEIIEDIADALSEAHHMGIIHRDIKPSNVAINHRGEVKVLDFGLAKQVLDEPTAMADQDAQTLLAARTRSGAIVGTPMYLSPEQAMGSMVDGRSDLFALGSVLYECITGRPPFNGGGPIEIAAQVIHVDPPPPSSINPRVPDQLDRIALKALAKNRDERYQNAAELIDDLRIVRAALDFSETPTRRMSVVMQNGHSSALMTFSNTMRRPRLSLAFFAVAVVLPLIAISSYYFLSRQKTHIPAAEAERWLKTGTTAIRDGAYYQASKALTQATVVDPQYALAHARLAEAWMELDYSDRAKNEMLRVATLVPERSILPATDALYLQAITGIVTGNLPEAVASYRELVKQVADADKPPVFVDLGRALEKMGERKQAIESYVEATTRDPQYATAFLRLGVLYGRNQELYSASAAFDKADALYQAHGNIEGRTEVFFQRGFLANNIGQIPQAREQLQQALDLARATGNRTQQISALLQLSSVAARENNMTQAQDYGRAAIETARQEGMETLLSRGLGDLGTVYFLRGDFTEAERYYRQALETAQRFNARRNESRARLMLGSLFVQSGNLDEAIPNLQQALAFYQQGSYLTESGQALLLLARANQQRGDYATALESYKQLFETAERKADAAQMFLASEAIGLVLLLQERYPEALDYFEKTHEQAKSMGDQLKIGQSLVNRAGALWQLGRYDEARVLFEQASEIAAKSGGGYDVIRTNIFQLKAEVAFSQRRFADAAVESRKVMTLMAANKIDVAEAQYLLGLAKIFSGAKAEGLRLCEEAVEQATGSNNPLLLARARLALAEAALENGDNARAFSNARQSQEFFERTGQLQSLWQANLLAARAAGDAALARDHLDRADAAFNQLSQRLGPEITTYLTRPDVLHYRQQTR